MALLLHNTPANEQNIVNVSVFIPNHANVHIFFIFYFYFNFGMENNLPMSSIGDKEFPVSHTGHG